MNWWGLPGPTAVARSCVGAVEEGRSFALRIPQWGVPDPADAIRGALAERFPQGAFSQRDVECDDRTALGELDAGTPRLSGSLIRLVARTPDPRSPPAEWIGAARKFNRSKRPHEKVVLWLEFWGPATAAAVKADSDIEVFDVRGVVSLRETLVYSQTRCEGEGLPPVLEDLKCAIVANLAIWDPQLVEELGRKPLRTLLDPGEALRGVARARGWDGMALTDMESSWALGVADDIAGRRVLHSAWLGRNGDSSEVKERIWNGQVAVLLPFIERRRREFLRKYSAYWDVPKGESPASLEIKDLHDQARVRIGTELSRLAPQLGWLRIARNRLAHLECLGCDELLGQLARQTLSS